jgi:probable HAF family extracellular repeat protein
VRSSLPTLLCLLSAAISLGAAPSYVVEVLDCPEGKTCEITAINNRGQALVGVYYWTDPYLIGHVYVWSGDSLQDVGSLSSAHPYTLAYRINEHGQVAGVSDTDDLEQHAFFSENGVMRALDVPAQWRSSWVTDLNDRGEVVGYGLDDQFELRPFHWRDGVLTLVPELRYVNAINERGAMVGEGPAGAGEAAVPMLWEDGRATALSDERGAAVEINDHGEVAVLLTDVAVPFHWSDGVLSLADAAPTGGNPLLLDRRGRLAGTRFTAQPHPAFVWERGAVTDLEIEHAVVVGMNEKGDVVGHDGERAFLWHEGNVTYLEVEGARSFAVDVNDFGQVAGKALYSDGSWSVVVWSPVPGARSRSLDGGAAWE